MPNSETRITKKWDPDFYDKNSGMQYQTSMTILEAFTLNGNERVLDIGSGNGKITFQISKRLPQGEIIGLDLSNDMVEFARTHYQSCNLSFMQKNVLEMDFNEKFDIIVSFWTLSWVENQKLALHHILRALKPNGRMLIIYPLRHDAYDVAEKLIIEERWKNFFTNFTGPRPFFSESDYNDIISTMTDAEFTIAHKEITCYFNTIDEMSLSIKSWMTYLDVFPNDELKEEFLNEFIAAYLEYRNIKEFTLYFSILEIHAIKIDTSKTNAF